MNAQQVEPLINRYKELFQSHNPYLHEKLANENELEYHYDSIEKIFQSTMKHYEFCQSPEQEIETSKEVNSDMIDNSENQKFTNSLEFFLEKYELSVEDKQRIEELLMEVPIAITNTFPWEEVKNFAKQLQLDDYDLNSEEWQENFNIYMKQRLKNEEFISRFDQYINV